MKKPANAIPMYWWEGFYGFTHSFRRIAQQKSPLVSNAGDLLSPLIISLITDKQVQHSTSANKLLALGSIFFALKDNDTVWGSGFLNAKHIQYSLSCKNVTYLAVRGPETRKLLMKHDITCPEVYGDPAILLPQLIKNNLDKKYVIGVVPHFSQYKYFQKTIQRNDVKVINIENSVSKVMCEILSCDIILSTSLHGLIIAEAYDIPALMLVMDKPHNADLFKFEDYFHSTNRSISFTEFNVSQLNIFADLAIKQNKPYFNAEKLLESFPFHTSHSHSNPPKLSWSNMSTIKPRLHIPPRFTVL